MKSIEEIITEELNQKKSRFSVSAFSRLLLCYMNDPEFETHIIKTKGDVATVIKEFPVKKFRKYIQNILIDFGVDKSDAKKILSEYKFSNKDIGGLYDFLSDFLYQYLKTGRTLELFKKIDSQASISMKDEDEKVKEYDVRKIKDGSSEVVGKTKKKYKKHRKVTIKNSCPKWQTEDLDPKTDSVLKFMRTVVEE